MANDGQALLDDLEPIAYRWTGAWPSTSDDIRSFCGCIWLGEPLSRWGGGLVLNPATILRWRPALSEGHLESVAPLVHLFDSSVATGLMRLRTSQVLGDLQRVSTAAEVVTVYAATEEDHSGLARGSQASVGATPSFQLADDSSRLNSWHAGTARPWSAVLAGPSAGGRS